MPTTATTQPPSKAGRALARHVARVLRRGTLVWAVVLALAALVAVVNYERRYGTPLERAHLQAGLGRNLAIQALVGHSWRLDSAGAFAAARLSIIVGVVVSIWGLLAATRQLRGEEETGRWELVLAGPLSRRRATAATLAGVGLNLLALWTTLTAVLLALASGYGFARADALLLATALVAGGAAFAAVGALAAQLASTRRGAAGLAALALGAAYLLRLIADGIPHVAWLRWLTPLGWIEQLRPFAGARLLPLVPLALWTLALAAAALWLAGRRDTGVALLPQRAPRRGSRRSLGSPLAVALRLARPNLGAWLLGVALYALIVGAISDDIVSSYRSGELSGGFTGRGVSLNTLDGYLSFALFFPLQVVVSLLAASQINAAREEEETGRLEQLLATPLQRRRWLAGRSALTVAALALVALAAGMLAWAAGASRGATVPLAPLLGAALNSLPIGLLFLGLGLLLQGFRPRAVGILSGLVGVSFLWEFVGSLTPAPSWLLGLSPFHHVAAAPAQPVDTPATIAMLAAALAAAVAGTERFARRDLVGA